MVSRYWSPDLPQPTTCDRTTTRETPSIFGLWQGDDWFLFTDNQAHILYTPHSIYAYHMPTGDIKEILHDDSFTSISDYAVYGDEAVLVTLTRLEDDPGCQGNSIVTLVNLVTNERRELYSGCIHNTFYYDLIGGLSLGEDYIALVRLLHKYWSTSIDMTRKPRESVLSCL